MVERVVGDTREAGTEAKVWLPVENWTDTSKCPGEVDTTRIVAGSVDAVSVWSVMTRSNSSPPKRRDGNDVQGDEYPTSDGCV